MVIVPERMSDERFASKLHPRRSRVREPVRGLAMVQRRFIPKLLDQYRFRALAVLGAHGELGGRARRGGRAAGIR
jgi:hypothetical protein